MNDQHEHLQTLVGPLRGKTKMRLPYTGEPHGRHAMSAARVAEHRGKKIEIRTSYKITVDGELLDLHTSVMNDGRVHCHSLPQYSFSSAIRMVKSVIDVMDIEEPADELNAGQKHHGHGG